MNVENIATGKDSRLVGGQLFINQWTVGPGIEADSGFLGQLILGNQTNRQQQGITGDHFPGFVNHRKVLINLSHLDCFQMRVADDIRYRG